MAYAPPGCLFGRIEVAAGDGAWPLIMQKVASRTRQGLPAAGMGHGRSLTMLKVRSDSTSDLVDEVSADTESLIA
jgi:hypothetical protein